MKRPIPWRNPRLAGRLVELDGIRGLAILLVLIWHYLVCQVTNLTPGSWQAHLLATLRLTWSGVDLFFVLSGFLIGGILYDAKDSRSYYPTFYRRRICRIFPVYFAWIALFLCGLCFVEFNGVGGLRETFNRDLPVWSYPLFLQNLMMASRGTFGTLWMGITWSLAVEEQFYLLLPMLIKNLSYRGVAWVALSSIVCAPIIRLALSSSGSRAFGPYVLLPSRADAFGFGILVALSCRNVRAWDWLASHRKHIYWIFGGLGCGLAVLIKYPRFLYTLGLTWIAAFYALLLLLTVVNPGRLERLCFGNRVLVKLGTVAYAVYIFHQGVNALLHVAILGGGMEIRGWLSLSVTLLSLIVVMLMATLSWRFMERPLIRHAHARYQYSEPLAAEFVEGEPELSPATYGLHRSKSTP